MGSDVYNTTFPGADLDNRSFGNYNEMPYCQDDEEILKNVSFLLFSITFVLGIIGNGLVIWIAGFRMKKTVSAVWFLNLAIADFLCCATVPLRNAQWTSLYTYSYTSLISCILTIILFTMNMSASVLLLTAMSIDRCVSVLWPFWAKVHRTLRLVKITAGVIWVLSFLLTGLLFYLYGFFLFNIKEWCVHFSDVNDFNYEKQIVQLIRLVIMFVIPFLIIVTNYLIIFLRLRNSKRPQRSQRPYRIITAVILCFFICWCPYYIWPLTPEYEKFEVCFNTVNIIIIVMATLNSSINPIIYVFMGQDVRQDVLRSISGRMERALDEQTDNLSREPEDHEHPHTTNV